MPLLTVFLDTSVILSGIGSPAGGSAALFLAAKKKRIILVTTPRVLEEAVEHLSKVSNEPSRLKPLFSTSIITLVPNPSDEILEKFTSLTTDPDDVHVIAGAVRSAADVLLSLDKKHITTHRVKRALKPIRVLSPRQFWQQLIRERKKRT